jgi:uncharacterized RDD family membrane protein YckC
MNGGMTGELKIDTLQSVEVAEGVDILLRPAGPLPRAYAYLLDAVIRSLIVFVLALLFMLSSAFFGFKMMEFGGGLMLIAFFLLEWGYYVISEAIWGTSLGKKAFKLKVVRTSGVPIGWGAAVLRNLLRTVDGMPWALTMPSGLIGIGSCVLTRKFQRIGDLLADTVVVYATAGWEYTAPELRPDARARLNISPPPLPLTREEQQSLVLFLERAGLWSEGRKEELANHLHPLTGLQGRPAVEQLLGHAVWLRDS